MDRALMCRPCAALGHTRGPDGFRDLGADCDGTGRAEPRTDLPVQQHARRMIRTAWALGHFPRVRPPQALGAHLLGIRGHFAGKSRAYSATSGR
ncbi:replication initiator [Streptomyces sp. LUP30]|uniref:replication initiator n=1 Tax=Streptomyces sp. LUP30 TaxID=1890285 RepID=UPI00159F2C07|nr:replication initiator [Streptomyces sp. LUP30]